MMLTPTATHNRRTRWVLTGLEAGALLFLAGLAVLYLNPFWHFDEGGFLDHRVHWWNAAGEILIGTGLLTEVLALVAGAALLVSGFCGRRAWPYPVAASIMCCAVLGISFSGFTRDVAANFEWNASDGFTAFSLQLMEEDGAAGPVAGGALWQSTVAAQVQPMLRSYFKLNDWQKMNGEIAIKVARIIPIAWPIDLGSGGETLKDPDETELMRAASQEDFKAVQQLLSTAANANVNALDQTGQTALILACQNPKASPDVVKSLLTAGADVNLRGRNGYTALTWALARNNGEVIRLLRRAGARQ
jgi:uncharacterized membrane protein YphA (DoxX/SURF4 family)